MINDLDDTIKKLLIEEGRFDASEVDVSFNIPNREWAVGISKPTLNCYLFDIRENRDLRQHGMQTETLGQRGMVRQRPPMRFDLTYLVTAWTNDVDDEHRLLWRVLQTLIRFETVPRAYLQGTLLESDMPIYARAALPDSVLKSPGEFWTALENQIKPSLSYVLTIALNRDALPVLEPLVLTSRVRLAQGDRFDEQWVWFGGVVRDDGGEPVKGALVEIADRGLQAETDAQGRFRMRIPGPGSYTLTARFGASTQTREIQIPDISYDIALD
jgi:hypothetical protein